MPPPLGGSSRGCPAVWSICHHKGYCSRLSTVSPPHTCGLSCGATPIGRRPPPGLCTGSPVTGCFHGPRWRLPWSPMQPGRARTGGLGVPYLPLARWVGCVAAVRPTHGVLVLSCHSAALRVCGVLCHLAPVHWCAGVVCCVASAVSWANWLLFTGAPARCVVLGVRCPGPLGSGSPVCPLGVLCCVCGVLGHFAPGHRCACSVCCFACAVSWATWLLLTGVPARSVVLCVRCPGPLNSCSPVCWRGLLCCVCGVLGHLAPVHRCAPSVGCVVCAVLLGDLAPVHQCACVVCCVACAVSWATWLLFTGAPARCVVLPVRCPGPLRSCSPVCPLAVLCCVCGVVGHLDPVHRCTRSVGCVLCAVSWATWLLFTGVPAWFVVLCLRCPEQLGSCSPVCPLGGLCCVCCVSRRLGSRSPVCPCCLLCCLCGVLGHVAPVHRSAPSVRCSACAVS